MNKQEIMDKVQALMQDEQFKTKLANAESMDDMAALFCNEGIQVTGAELEEAVSQQDGDELSEDSLENVAGGFAVSGLIAAGCIIFVGGSILLGYIDGVKKKYKSCRR